MRISVGRSDAKTAERSARTPHSASPAPSAPSREPGLLQAQPPAELIALQRLIARRAAPPADERPEPDDSHIHEADPPVQRDRQQGEDLDDEAAVQSTRALHVQRAPAQEVTATPVTQGASAAPPPPPPAQDLIYRVTADGDRSGRAPAKKPEWTATLKERGEEVGKQAADGTLELTDRSKLKLTDAGTPFAPTGGNRVQHPVQPDETQGVGLLNGTSSLDVQNYSELTPTGESSKFSASYEFKGDARAGLVGLIKAKQTDEKYIPNALSDDQKLRERTFGGLQAVELTVKGTSVSANSEGAINNPRDDSHTYETSIKQRVPAGEFYQPLRLDVFEAMLKKLKDGKAAVDRRARPAAPAAPAPATPNAPGSTATPAAPSTGTTAPAPSTPPAPDANDIAAEAYKEIVKDSAKAVTSAEELGFFVTATASRGFGNYPNLKVFLRANYPEYSRDGVAAEPYFEKSKVTDRETNIPLNLFQNFITGFVNNLKSYFPVGALGLIWLEGKESSVQAFYIGDAKGPGSKEKDTRLEAPKTLLEKVDGKNVTGPVTGPNLTPSDIESIKQRVLDLNDKPYQLKGQTLHVLIFPGTAKEAEFFFNKEQRVVRKEDANDPFGLLQRYLRARSAGLN